MVEALNNTLRRVPVWAFYIIGALPFVWLVVQLLTDQLGVDPVKVIEHRLGELGLQFLIAGLAASPLRKYAGINLLKFRRAIGVLCFFYILAHLLTWLVLDIQLLWGQIWADILKRPYITIGMAGFLLLLPLAITSNDLSLRKLGALRWRKLHKLAYPAAVLGAVHFVLVVKGWQVEPFIYLGVVVALLMLRLRLPWFKAPSRA